MTHRIATLLSAAMLIAAACGDSGDNAPDTSPGTTAGAETTEAPAATSTAPATTEAPDEPPSTTATTAGDVPPSGEYDPSLTRDDVDCSEAALAGDGGEFANAFVSAHFVVDGTLGQVCFGEEDPLLLETWDLLSTITPSSDREPLALLAGFDMGGGTEEGATLAFVNVVGDGDGTAFQMSMNLPASDADPVDFAVTVAHEFSHILTGEFEQLDREADPATCDTYDNGEGCFLPGAYLDEWVAEFWPPDLLDQIDPEAVDDEEGALDRCDLDPGFLGAYAATNPDEDFAESFAAFVFRIPVPGPSLAEKNAFFEQRAELVAYQELAVAAGLVDLPNNFGGCG